MEEHLDFLRAEVPEAGSVARNSLQNPVTPGFSAPFGAKAGPSLAEPKTQTVRGSVIRMMAGGAGDILVAAQDGVKKQQPSDFDGLGIYGMKMAVIENGCPGGGGDRLESEPDSEPCKRGLAGCRTAALVLLVLAGLAAPALADIERARQLMKAGAFEEAREQLWPAARSGNADAEELIGVMYALGLGVERDDIRAFEWYLRAAMKGHPGAQSGVGWYYEVGRGMPAPDLVRAYVWYVLSTIGGDPDAAISQEEVVKKMTPKEIEQAHRLINDYRIWLFPFR